MLWLTSMKSSRSIPPQARATLLHQLLIMRLPPLPDPMDLSSLSSVSRTLHDPLSSSTNSLQHLPNAPPLACPTAAPFTSPQQEQLQQLAFESEVEGPRIRNERSAGQS